MLVWATLGNLFFHQEIKGRCKSIEMDFKLNSLTIICFFKTSGELMKKPRHVVFSRLYDNNRIQSFK